ncbi:hypothetical protein IFM89_010889 [Coptis chinensis]|uniref:Uncharacterized protein n=1 Tax=Coptis chinensis TaxID=261450 RepID=A0A835I324_9MAGN|nr:hypothetical protein IFM89_010889 [Coptis chinensis]
MPPRARWNQNHIHMDLISETSPISSSLGSNFPGNTNEFFYTAQNLFLSPPNTQKQTIYPNIFKPPSSTPPIFLVTPGMSDWWELTPIACPLAMGHTEVVGSASRYAHLSTIARHRLEIVDTPNDLLGSAELPEEQMNLANAVAVGEKRDFEHLLLGHQFICIPWEQADVEQESLLSLGYESGSENCGTQPTPLAVDDTTVVRRLEFYGNCTKVGESRSSFVSSACGSSYHIPQRNTRSLQSMEQEMVVEVYKECQRNRAAGRGMHATDGCQEFVRDNSKLNGMYCEACGCHQNFHNKVFIQERRLSGQANMKQSRSSKVKMESQVSVQEAQGAKPSSSSSQVKLELEVLVQEKAQDDQANAEESSSSQVKAISKHKSPPKRGALSRKGRVEGFREDPTDGVQAMIKFYFNPDDAEYGRRSFHGEKEVFLSDMTNEVHGKSIKCKINVYHLDEYLQLRSLKQTDYFYRIYYDYEKQTFKTVASMGEVMENGDLRVYCKCCMPENPDEFWIECNGCCDWFHPHCTGTTREEVDKPGYTYFCPDCSAKGTDCSKLIH